MRKSNPSSPRFVPPALKVKATRHDILQITKAMMKTWRAIDVELEGMHARLSRLEAFAGLDPQAPADEAEPPLFLPDDADATGQSAELAVNPLDAQGPEGDVTTATDGSEGEESEDQL